ncbi:hypothetical protein CPB85DRAFT_1427860 [Mucidula mucida]|nr:hypothetical protein CPB85DRAFT_1427860 [Mucidula mucida]
MTTAPSNNRASLLSGLRTGGVRSTSTSMPHTAGVAGSFSIPRFASQHHQSIFPEEDEDDFVAEMPAHNAYSNKLFGNRTHPMTAAVDGPNNRFSQHQQRGMNPNSAPFTPSFATNMMAQPNAQTQAFQMQMMQMEMLRLQALQAQQLQAEMLAQAHLQQQQIQAENRRVSLGYVPASAGPASSSFDLRAASGQMRRARQEQNLSVGEDHLPMTAALGGRFGSRVPSMPTGQVSRFPPEDSNEVPPTPGSTTVISGGTSLGNLASNNVSQTSVTSKSDSASSWRRADKNNSVLRGNRAISTSTTVSPSVKVTPPPGEQPASPPGLSPITPVTAKARPQPLRFSAAVSQPLPAVTIDTSDSNDDDADSTSSSKSGSSSPTTPHSSSSNEMPLSPREEASKKLYEGLGIGRPRSSASNTTASGGVEIVTVSQQNPISVSFSHRMASQPTRQPRGPPSGADELGPKNFATRIRRKAIGGLGMLMGARERRELVEVF